VSKGPTSRRRCPIDVFRYRDYRLFLAAYYQAKKPTGFSYRGFSKAAALGAPNYLKLVIEGKRNLTPEMAARFAEACALSNDAAEYFVALVHFNQASGAEQKNAAYSKLRAFRRYRRSQKLDVAEAAYHSTWYLPAIRELVLSPDFREDPEWLAALLRPSIKPAEVVSAIHVLLELGLLQRDAAGRLLQVNRVLSTGPETAGLHIANYHLEMMRRAAQSIDLIERTERDISSLTLCVGPNALVKLKQRLQEFRRELVELADTESAPCQVIQLNLQLFPLTYTTQNPTNKTRSQA
jgi:uncharacterized protein (TIGR02147 family)